jgi:microcystin-dependent protein
MPYQVTFTDSTNPVKPPITVADQSVNSQTSLDFVGKNYAGYAPKIAESFLHILENFASNTAPRNPVEGQLWYDNTNNVHLLKIYDGTTWTAAGSVKKSPSSQQPPPANSVIGDLWADTTNSQLYIFTGSNWVLVGPQFSQGTLTGPQVENIVDTMNVSHSVVTIYSNNNAVAIISQDSFTPKSTLNGFTIINKGVNLYTDSTYADPANGYSAGLWGTAQQAVSLLYNGSTVAATNFLRKDISDVSSFPISVRANGGITVGSALSMSLVTDDTGNGVLYNNSSNKSMSIRVTQSNVPYTALYIDSQLKIGVGKNNSSPQATLDVIGQVNIGDDTASSILGRLIVNGTSDIGELSTGLGDPGGPSIQTMGGLSVAKKTQLSDDLSVGGQVYLNWVDSTGSPVTGSAILPVYTGIYDIGSADYSFRNIYADSFVGNFTGTFTGTLQGNISGTAARLASATEFILQGDVGSSDGGTAFTGQTTDGKAYLNTVISPDFISTKPQVTDSLLTDEMLVYRPSVGLVNITKSTLFSHIPQIPVGIIFPFAGSASAVPTGYLLCDGSEVLTAEYPTLFSVIGYTYKASASLIGLATFALPDLRGRFPLGKDDMDNGIEVPAKDGSGILLNSGGGSANRVSDITGKTLGTGSGGQQVTIQTRNLPDHKHNLSSNAAQYYAPGLPSGVPDPAAIPSYGLPNFSTGSGLPNSGGVIPDQNTTLGNALNVMNPYATLNYIIYTGVI